MNPSASRRINASRTGVREIPEDAATCASDRNISSSRGKVMMVFFNHSYASSGALAPLVLEIDMAWPLQEFRKQHSRRFQAVGTTNQRHTRSDIHDRVFPRANPAYEPQPGLPPLVQRYRQDRR